MIMMMMMMMMMMVVVVMVVVVIMLLLIKQLIYIIGKIRELYPQLKASMFKRSYVLTSSICLYFV